MTKIIFFFSIITNLCLAQWINIFDVCQYEKVHGILKESHPNFNIKLNTGDAAQYMFDGSMQVIPCGPLQAFMVTFNGAKDLTIIHFPENNQISASEKSSGSILQRSGIEISDRIVGINGKLFMQEHKGNKETGEYGPIYELAVGIEEGQRRGMVELLIERGKKTTTKDKKMYKSVKVKIEKLPPFAKNFPLNCKRSAMIAEEIVQIMNKKNTGSNPLMGLTALAWGDEKHKDILEKFMMSCLAEEEKNNKNKLRVGKSSEGGGWAHGFKLIYLAEYFFATGDMDVFPTLQTMCYDVNDKYQNPFGGGGHGKKGIGTYWSMSFGPPTGLSVLGAAIAEKAGCKVPQETYQAYYDMTTYTSERRVNTGNNDYVFEAKKEKEYYSCYDHCLQESDQIQSWAAQCLNTGVAALAYNTMNFKNHNVPIITEKLENNLLHNFTNFGYIHTTPALGFHYATFALNAISARNQRALSDKVLKAFNNDYTVKFNGNITKSKTSKEIDIKPLKEMTAAEAFRKILDYRKHPLVLCRLNSETYYYFYPKQQNSGNWGGDYYMGIETSGLYALLSYLSAYKNNLAMYGGKKRNWYSKISPKLTLEAMKEYNKYYSESLVKQMNDKLDEIDKDKSKSERVEIQIDAYLIGKKVLTHYRDFPAAKSANGIMKKIESAVGGKGRMEMMLKNREAEKKLNYAVYVHERRNTENWMDKRTKILQYILNTSKGLPVEKRALDELYKTKKMVDSKSFAAGNEAEEKPQGNVKKEDKKKKETKKKK